MLIEAYHPRVAFRDCAHCLKFIYNEETGKPLLSNGQLTPRPAVGAPPPCRPSSSGSIKGCPKGTPEQPLTLSQKNRDAVAYYRRRMAVGRIPDDPLSEEIVAMIIRADRQIERHKLVEGISETVMGAISAALASR